MPSPWVAETGSGSPRPRPWNSAVTPKSLGRSALLTATRTGTSPPRRVFASSASPARRPARPSTTISTASASAIASRAWLCTSRASSASSSRSMPPVSISSKATPFHSQREPLAVAGDAGLGRGHGLAAADQAVDQGALADVGEADDGDGGQRGSSRRPRSRARRDDSADDLFQAERRWCRARPRPRRRAGRRARARCRGRRGGAGRRAPTRSPRRSAAARRRARSSSEAVRKTFSGESGLTTVPMSRPSAT